MCLFDKQEQTTSLFARQARTFENPFIIFDKLCVSALINVYMQI